MRPWRALGALRAAFSALCRSFGRHRSVFVAASARFLSSLVLPVSRLPRRCLPGCDGRPAPVALDVEFEDVGAVDEAVDGGKGHGVAAEDPAPGAEGLVGDHQERAVLVARADEFEEHAGLRLLAGDAGEVVEDEEVELVEPLDGGIEGEVPAGRLELLHQGRRALVEHPEPVLDQGQPEARGQMALARTGRTGDVVLTDPVLSSATPGIRSAVVSWKSPDATSEAARRVL